MAKNYIQILNKEHENILSVADVIEKECNGIKSGKELDKDFFNKAVDFIENYTDKFHHSKEEDILFKELCKPEAEMHCNPVDQMLYEHDIGRNFVKGIKEGIKKGDKEKIVENALGYVQLIREHIFKEDNILYPMSESALNKESKDSIQNRFEKVLKSMEEENKKYSKIIGDFKKR